MQDKVNLEDAFSRFEERWSPRVVAALNGQHVRVAKLEGAFCWHRHDDEDELFLVLEGTLRIELREREILLEAGELFVVPRGVEHRPVAEGLVHALLFEPSETVNTGDAEDDRRRERLDWIA